MEVRELLQEYGYNADDTPVICGSALYALEVCYVLSCCQWWPANCNCCVIYVLWQTFWTGFLASWRRKALVSFFNYFCIVIHWFRHCDTVWFRHSVTLMSVLWQPDVSIVTVSLTLIDITSGTLWCQYCGSLILLLVLWYSCVSIVVSWL